MWRKMKDRGVPLTDPDGSNFGFRKTSNPPTDHLNHLIHHLNHLIHYHPHHLNQIGLEDFLQSWQSNTSALFWKHCRKLEADLDSRAEVLQSSSVLFTSIQVKTVSIKRMMSSYQVSFQAEPCISCARIKVSREPQLLFFHQITGKNSIQFSLV